MLFVINEGAAFSLAFIIVVTVLSMAKKRRWKMLKFWNHKCQIIGYKSKSRYISQRGLWIDRETGSIYLDSTFRFVMPGNEGSQRDAVEMTTLILFSFLSFSLDRKRNKKIRDK